MKKVKVLKNWSEIKDLPETLEAAKQWQSYTGYEGDETDLISAFGDDLVNSVTSENTPFEISRFHSTTGNPELISLPDSFFEADPIQDND